MTPAALSTALECMSDDPGFQRFFQHLLSLQLKINRIWALRRQHHEELRCWLSKPRASHD
jgi:hypothetical protein